MKDSKGGYWIIGLCYLEVNAYECLGRALACTTISQQMSRLMESGRIQASTRGDASHNKSLGFRSDWMAMAEAGMGKETQYTPGPVVHKKMEEETSFDRRKRERYAGVMTSVCERWANMTDKVAPSEVAIESPIKFEEGGRKEKSKVILTQSEQVKKNVRREDEATKAVRGWRDEEEDVAMTPENQGTEYEEESDDIEIDWDSVSEPE